MSAIPPPALAATLACIIDLVCRAVAARGVGGWLGGLSVILIWGRLRRLAGRFVRLAARIEAGRDRPRHRPRPAAARPPRPTPPPRLPRGRGWLLRLVPEAAAGGSQLQALLATPEMAALLAAAPQVGRTLRPLCRMLGVDPPPALRTPPHRPPPQAAPLPPTAPAAAAAAAARAAGRSAGPPRRRPPRHAAAPPPRCAPRGCGPPLLA